MREGKHGNEVNSMSTYSRNDRLYPDMSNNNNSSASSARRQDRSTNSSSTAAYRAADENGTDKAQLLNNGQPLYTAAGVQEFVQRSPRNRCCCISCCCVCITLIIVGIAIGIAAAVIANECLHPKFSTIKTMDYGAVNTTGLSFEANGLPGTIRIMSGADVVNGSVSVKLMSNKDTLSAWKTTLSQGSDGKVQAALTGSKAFAWDECPHAQINITVPASVMRGFGITIKAASMSLELKGLMAIQQELGVLDVESTNGAVYVVDGVRASRITVKSDNGQLMLNKAQSNTTMTATTTNGAVNITEGAANGLTVTTDNGQVDVNKASVTGVMSLSTTNGGITVTKLAVRNGGAIPDGKVTAVNGNVEIGFDKSFKGSYSVSTTNGNIQVNKKDQNGKSATGDINGGGGSKVTVMTTNGGVDIEF